MPLDTNIALSLKPLQLNDPLETQVRRQQVQSNALAMRNAESQNALAQQAALDKQVMNKLYAESYDPETGSINYDKLGAAAAGLGRGSELPGIQAEGQKFKANQQTMDKEYLGNVSSALDLRRRALEGVTTVDDFIMWHDGNHKDRIVGGYLASIGSTREQAMARIEAARNDPAAFAKLLQESKIGTEKTQAAVDVQANRDTQIEVQGMIGKRMANRPVGRAAPARAATGGGAAPAAVGAPGGPGKAGKAPPNPALVAASQDEKIGRIRGVLAEAKKLIGPTTTGVIGEVASRVGGTKSRDLSGKLETIKANLGFDELQKMRDASPTGGALGQVAVKELISLQATVASLDQGLSEGELKKSIEKIEQHYNAWYEAVLKARSGAQPAAVTKASPNAKLYDEADAILNRGRK